MVNYIQIRFTRFCDPVPAQRAVRAERELASVREAIARKQAAAEVAQSEADRSVERQTLAELERRRDTLLAAEELLAREAAKAAATHPRAGHLGYQVVDERMQVVRIVDADGDDLPRGAHYGSEVVDPDPPRPAWADAKETEWAATR